MSRKGGIADSEPIFGPFGTYFGRSVGAIRSQLVDWPVPGSGGRVARVHRSMLPALQKVAANLAAEAASGRVYTITSVSGFTARTIGGSHQLSRHALGLAIDINPAQNPYQEDGTLFTDMPPWFVDAWRSAGFCWGGDWIGVKDPMHFSWMGPGAAGSAGSPLSPRAPATSTAPFGGLVASHPTPFAPVMNRYAMSVIDATGNGAPDVVGVRSHPDGAVIDIATSTGGYGQCSIARWFVPDPTVATASHVVFGDFDGDSGQDLIALFPSDGSLGATVATRRQRFEDLAVRPTNLSLGAVAVAAADYDGDRSADLWEATADGRLRVWRGPAWTELISDTQLPSGAPIHIAAGDRDSGDVPELYALYAAGTGSRLDVLTYVDAWVPDGSVSLATAPGSIVAVGAGDYDGDGRSDAQVLESSGTMRVHLGNTSTGIPASRWFLHPEWECEDTDVQLSYNGAFYDDEHSPFQPNIDSIAAAEVTRGCNPPFGDRFCPDAVVTRGAMAAFLVRALGLEVNTHPGFIDVVPGSVFAEDIGRLATAGITFGCTAGGERFCPYGIVTRGAMAAFLARALGLEVNTHPDFIDVVPGSVFAEDIGRLATSGITRGCTAGGDQFCPDDAVTRGAMAAFLDRAGLGWQP